MWQVRGGLMRGVVGLGFVAVLGLVGGACSSHHDRPQPRASDRVYYEERPAGQYLPPQSGRYSRDYRYYDEDRDRYYDRDRDYRDRDDRRDQPDYDRDGDRDRR